MKIETVAIDSLVFDPANARKHGQKNIDSIKGSLTKFGQQKPIVVDAKGVVLAGNGTLASAKALGWTQIDVVRSTLDAVNATAFSIADNRAGELAEWDDKVLADVLASLKLNDFDLDSIGFDESDLNKILNGDEAGPTPEEIEGTATMSEELNIDREYMVVLFDKPEDFNTLATLLNHSPGCGYWLTKNKTNPAFFRKGPNRIFSGRLLLDYLSFKAGAK